MRKFLILPLVLLMLAVPAQALDFEAPPVPDAAEKFMPPQQENFLQGVLEVLQDAVLHIHPDLREAAAVCLSIAAVVMCVSILRAIPGASEQTITLAGSIGIAVVLFQSSNSLINLAASTVIQVSEYGKLLLPVMTAAMAARGGISSSTALYVATAFFDALLTSVIRKLLTPLIYLILLLSVANSAIGQDTLKRLRDTLKGLTTWSLKTILYVYTGFISITGVVSGTTDAAALKAAKLTISGAVPVVGGILSDASEAVLVSAGILKNAAGIYGFFAILAIWIGPFLRIGVHYLLLKGAGAVCSIFAGKAHTELIQDFSSAMGLLLALTGTTCLMFMISLVCYLKGVG